jgi:hypothetical protein
MPVRISVASEGDDEKPRDLRASSGPPSPVAKAAVPFSKILAARRDEVARSAAAKSNRPTSRGPSQREHGWSSTSLEDTQLRGGTKSSQGTNSTNRIRKLSPRALMRKYRSRMKPRTFLLLVFASVSLMIMSLHIHFCE